MVPNLPGTRDWFHGRQFFCGWQGGGYGFGLNQAYYVYCALYFYLSLFVLSLFLLLLYQFYLRSTRIRSQSLETPAINYNTGLSVQRVVIYRVLTFLPTILRDTQNCSFCCIFVSLASTMLWVSHSGVVGDCGDLIFHEHNSVALLSEGMSRAVTLYPSFGWVEIGKAFPFLSSPSLSRECKFRESVRHSVMSDSATPMDCSPPGSSVNRVFQARILSIGFSRQEYWVGCHSLLQGIFTTQG